MTQTALHQPQPKPASRPAWTAPPARSRLLQRKCACGGTIGASGECEDGELFEAMGYVRKRERKSGLTRAKKTPPPPK